MRAFILRGGLTGPFFLDRASMALHCGVWAGALGKGGVSGAKTRMSNWAQLIRARVEGGEGLAGPIGGVWRLVGSTGYDLGSEGRVGGEHAMKANEMQSWTWDERGQALEEFQRAHHEMGGAIAIMECTYNWLVF